mgnify:CR=1 FL=1
MRLCELYIVDYKQFQDFHLDLTYPKGHSKAGFPLDKVCFIGANGTGKTMLLRMIDGLLKFQSPKLKHFIAKYYDGKNFFYLIDFYGIRRLVNTDIDDEKNWRKEFIELVRTPKLEKRNFTDILDDYTFGESFDLMDSVLFIYSPSESQENKLMNITDVPESNVNKALQFFGESMYHTISNDSIEDFWTLLIYHIKKREEAYSNFQNLSENQDKTIKELKKLFNKENPEILKSLSEIWNKILGKAGLYFDYEAAKNPIQLTDNLKAYIKHKRTGETIPYNALSTGIRNFIFKVGHIYSLYFNRSIAKGYLLIDEPENSLFPDFLYGLLDIYTEITENTHIFMATHSPIIAAQFEPEERVILKFDEEGFGVKAYRGVMPVGDDPNDILIKDFGIQNILGKKGIEKWERFIELKILIRQAEDKTQKSELLEEYMEIGNAYNFPVQ